MSIRTERLAAVLQRDIGKILQQSYQPSGSFLTVTNVEVTDDLLIAKIFISVYAPGKDEEAIFEQLKQDNRRNSSRTGLKNQTPGSTHPRDYF